MKDKIKVQVMSVWQEVFDQVSDQVSDQVVDQVDDQVDGQVLEHFRWRIWFELLWLKNEK